jgi:hypothetical protein
MRRLYPTAAMENQLVVIVLHVIQDVESWVGALDTWVDHLQLRNWPCVGGVEILVQALDINTLATERTLPLDEKDIHTHETAVPLIYYVLPLETLSASLSALEETASNDDYLRVDLFLPSKFPTVFDDPTMPTLARQGRRRFLSISSLPPASNSSREDRLQLIDAAIGAPLESLLGQCMGMPADLADVVQLQTHDNSFPRWYTKLWFQQTLSERFQSTMELANAQRKELIGAHSTVNVTHGAVDRWLQAADWIRQSEAESGQGLYRQAADSLRHAVNELNMIQSDPELLEPLDFPREQYAAIFASLLFPLLLPLAIGLLREYRRYRELTDKKLSKI